MKPNPSPRRGVPVSPESPVSPVGPLGQGAAAAAPLSRVFQSAISLRRGVGRCPTNKAKPPNFQASKLPFLIWVSDIFCPIESDTFYKALTLYWL